MFRLSTGSSAPLSRETTSEFDLLSEMPYRRWDRVILRFAIRAHWYLRKCAGYVAIQPTRAKEARSLMQTGLSRLESALSTFRATLSEQQCHMTVFSLAIEEISSCTLLSLTPRHADGSP